MKRTITQSFRISNVTCPRIEFSLGSNYEKVDLKQGYRVCILIKDDKNIEVLFGVRLFETQEAKGKEDYVPPKLIIEVAGFVEFKKIIGSIKTVNDIPMIANILAMLYPFLREKVNYCFSNNGIPMLLPPLNVVNLLKDTSDEFKIVDTRKKNSTTKKRLKKS